MPLRLDADFVPVIKIRPHTTFWSPISPGRPSQSPGLWLCSIASRTYWSGLWRGNMMEWRD